MKEYKILFVALFMIIATMGFASAASTTNNPFLKVTLGTYSPIPAEPGKTVEVWVNVQNLGTSEAKNINFEFVDSPAFSIISEQDRVINIPSLGSQENYVMKYNLKISNNVADGSNDLTFKYYFGDTPGTVLMANVPIDVKSVETSISINDISIKPAPVVPGGKTTLSLNVRNLARSSNIRNVDVTVQLTPVVSSGVLVADVPFVAVNSGNQKSIDRIAPGQDGLFEFDLAVYPEAVSKLYKIPVTISYYDDTGRQYNKTILVGIEVNAKSDLLVNLESSDINSAVNSGNVLFNVINRGTSNVKLMTFTLVPTNDYEILSPSNDVYLGNIDSDDFQTAKFNVKTTKTDNVTFKVTLTYKDALNNEFKETQNVVYTLRAPVSTGKSKSSLWIILVIVILIVGIVWYRRRNKNKNK